MRKILFLILCFFPLLSQAGLDEVTISTEDKSCSIHYLSLRTKYNWTIKVDPSSCKNGWVDGVAKVHLFSPMKEQTETLSGFFKEGYWLDTFPLTKQIIERTSPGENIQSLSFLLGKDKEADITYVGQLRATQPKGRSYGAFLGCPDFRILVVVPDEKIFDNSAFQDKIVEQGLLYAHSYCAKPEVVALFGATSTTQPDILFRMQINPTTLEREILPLPPKEESLSPSPLELRTEKSDILLSVTSEEEKAIVSYEKVEIPKTNFFPVKEAPKEKEILNHLQIISRTFGHEVSGRTVVHINKILLDGTGLTDLPDEIQLLYYPNLKTGWAVVTGTLQKDKMKVSNVQFCQQEWCSDVP